MSWPRALVLLLISMVWLVVLALWSIGVGYEGQGFRLPMPGRDRWADLLPFYGLLAMIGWIAVTPLRRRDSDARD